MTTYVFNRHIGNILLKVEHHLTHLLRVEGYHVQLLGRLLPYLILIFDMVVFYQSQPLVKIEDYYTQ